MVKWTEIKHTFWRFVGELFSVELREVIKVLKEMILEYRRKPEYDIKESPERMEPEEEKFEDLKLLSPVCVSQK